MHIATYIIAKVKREFISDSYTVPADKNQIVWESDDRPDYETWKQYAQLRTSKDHVVLLCKLIQVWGKAEYKYRIIENSAAMQL